MRLLVNLPVLSLECTLPAQDFRLMQPDGEVEDEEGVYNGDDGDDDGGNDGELRTIEIYTLPLTKFCFTSGWAT